MTTPQFTWQISLGNVLTVAALIVAGVVAFQEVRGAGLQNARDIAALREALAEERAARMQAVSQANSEIRANTLSITRGEERHANIMAGLARIEARLDRSEVSK
jgi:endonuclease/exonuclease/phosphatase family metal-dependent hydrolase